MNDSIHLRFPFDSLKVDVQNEKKSFFHKMYQIKHERILDGFRMNGVAGKRWPLRT